MSERKEPDAAEEAGGRRIHYVPTAPHSLRGSLLVISFPTHGLAGSIATHYIVRALEMPQVAYLDGAELPPTVSVNEGLVRPPVRVYATELVCGPDGKCDRLAVISSDVPPPPELLRPLARTILARAQAENAGLVVVLEGIPSEEDEPERKVEAAANDLGRSVVRAAELGSIEGSITGFTAALFLEAIGRPIPVVSLAVRAHKSHPDARAAAQFIDSLRPLVPKISVDADPLRKKAEEIESALRANLRAQSRSIENLKTPPPSSMYV